MLCFGYYYECAKGTSLGFYLTSLMRVIRILLWNRAFNEARLVLIKINWIDRKVSLGFILSAKGYHMSNKIKHNIIKIALVFILGLLGACGGGTSSTGGTKSVEMLIAAMDSQGNPLVNALVEIKQEGELLADGTTNNEGLALLTAFLDRTRVSRDFQIDLTFDGETKSSSVSLNVNVGSVTINVVFGGDAIVIDETTVNVTPTPVPTLIDDGNSSATPSPTPEASKDTINIALRFVDFSGELLSSEKMNIVTNDEPIIFAQGNDDYIKEVSATQSQLVESVNLNLNGTFKINLLIGIHTLTFDVLPTLSNSYDLVVTVDFDTFTGAATSSIKEIAYYNKDQEKLPTEETKDAIAAYKEVNPEKYVDNYKGSSGKEEEPKNEDTSEIKEDPTATPQPPVVIDPSSGSGSNASEDKK